MHRAGDHHLLSGCAFSRAFLLPSGRQRTGRRSTLKAMNALVADIVRGQQHGIGFVVRRLMLLVSPLLVASCVSHGVVLPTARVKVVVLVCNHVSLSTLLLDLEGNLHVHGTVSAHGSSLARSGLVDAVVRTSRGEEWARGQTRYRLEHRPRLGPGPDFFNLTFEGLPPPGSIVEVGHHHPRGGP